MQQIFLIYETNVKKQIQWENKETCHRRYNMIKLQKKKSKWNGGKQPTRVRVHKNGYEDAQWI